MGRNNGAIVTGTRDRNMVLNFTHGKPRNNGKPCPQAMEWIVPPYPEAGGAAGTRIWRSFVAVHSIYPGAFSIPPGYIIWAGGSTPKPVVTAAVVPGGHRLDTPKRLRLRS